MKLPFSYGPTQRDPAMVSLDFQFKGLMGHYTVIIELTKGCSAGFQKYIDHAYGKLWGFVKEHPEFADRLIAKRELYAPSKHDWKLAASIFHSIVFANPFFYTLEKTR